LRIKDAGRSLDNADSLVGDTDLEDVSTLGSHNRAQLEAEVLGVHVQDEGVRKRLGLAGRDDGIVTDSAQVADNASRGVGILGKRLQSVERAANESELDGLLLVVCDLDHGLGRAAVDQLDAEDVGLGEAGRDIGVELRRDTRAASVFVKGLGTSRKLAMMRTRAPPETGPRALGRGDLRIDPGRRRRRHEAPGRQEPNTGGRPSWIEIADAIETTVEGGRSRKGVDNVN
jgi:hypothetical protein